VVDDGDIVNVKYRLTRLLATQLANKKEQFYAKLFKTFEEFTCADENGDDAPVMKIH
jgi:hypothetical protein